jgi:hypothetical protein
MLSSTTQDSSFSRASKRRITPCGIARSPSASMLHSISLALPHRTCDGRAMGASFSPHRAEPCGSSTPHPDLSPTPEPRWHRWASWSRRGAERYEYPNQRHITSGSDSCATPKYTRTKARAGRSRGRVPRVISMQAIRCRAGCGGGPILGIVVRAQRRLGFRAYTRFSWKTSPLARDRRISPL